MECHCPGELVRGNGWLGCPFLGMETSSPPQLLPLMEEHGWKQVHSAGSIGVWERGGSPERDKGAPQGGQPHSRLACPLVLQQRALSFYPRGLTQGLQTGPQPWKDRRGQPRRTRQGARVDCPGTAPWDLVEVPHPQPTFHPVSTNTHTPTASTEFFWPRIPPGKQARGMGDGARKMAPGPAAPAVVSARFHAGDTGLL